jgi:hypothetical protein
MRIATTLTALVLFSSAARADPAPCPAGLTRITVVHADGGSESVCGIQVRGERQRPYPFSVSGRAPLGYTAAEAPRSFVAEVLGPVRRSPF